MIDKLNLRDAFARFDDRWNPRIAGEVNDAHVKLAKLEGEFVWHRHEHEDELFLVLGGRLLMEYRDRESGSANQVWLEPGEMIVVPRGVEHRPHADEVTSILLFEPASTVATGNLAGEQAAEPLQRI